MMLWHFQTRHTGRVVRQHPLAPPYGIIYTLYRGRGVTMRYTLGDYTLDTHRYELCRAGISLKLQPKIFDLLAYLIQHRDRVVTRQELFDALWPERANSPSKWGIFRSSAWC